jgi:hypothetical protein
MLIHSSWLVRLERSFSGRICRLMLHRLFRPLLAVLVAIALIGAPIAAQAAMPCHGLCDEPAAGHTGSGHLPAPCKSMAPACMSALSCLSVMALNGPQNSAAPQLSELSVAYWAPDNTDHGLSVAPALDPPIAS